MTYQPSITQAAPVPAMRTDAEYRERAIKALPHIPAHYLEGAIAAHIAVEKAFDRQREWKAKHALNLPARLDRIAERNAALEVDPDDSRSLAMQNVRVVGRG